MRMWRISGWWKMMSGVLLVALMASAASVNATEKTGADTENDGVDNVRDRVEAALEAVNPALEAKEIVRSPIPGMMGVQLGNGQYIYVSVNGQYVFSGRLYERTESGIRDLTEVRLQEARKTMLQNADLSRAVTYESDVADPVELFVFTDVTCPYCERLHQHMDAINEAGITVHYLAFPRAGVNSKAGTIMSRAWCSADPKAALAQAFSKQPITQDSIPCVSPVAAQFQLGKKIGVTGTPGVYDASGRHLGGYLTVEQLKAALGLDAGANADADAETDA